MLAADGQVCKLVAQTALAHIVHGPAKPLRFVHEFGEKTFMQGTAGQILSVLVPI